ncbi:hypothetical protein U2261_10325 [Achromobacter xylosoxidans]|jgi:hypothetical protein|uniref:hypothetical protein n=1 Tax=Alcaligenes xylosoxydans xylosoxydans TaxID=85698 RepID=UPI002ACA3469|nr:hypothetical protein [Achromobacter xylosoxidans]MDZ5615003.1 hypothetical protein [Achromobacter xylosoxidans]MDZ5625793.1 hypothetical protein [Achromobacter xylosoxidans]MDZ5685360.1 hypothetical protein [Achromobacter xylosoxidans]
MADLIKPRVVMVKNRDGVEKAFTISRLPATAAREVIAKYPLSNIPKLGDYQTSEEVMKKLMSYVAVDLDGREQRLTTAALIDNHVDDGIQLMRLEIEMIEENTGFFGLGGQRGFLDCLLEKLLHSITPMLTPLLEQLSAQGSPDSLSSKQK